MSNEQMLPSIEPPTASDVDPEMTIKLPLSAAHQVVLQLYRGPHYVVAGILASIQEQLAAQVVAICAAQAQAPESAAETTSKVKH